MFDASSVTAWIERIKAGGPQREPSAQKLWHRYLHRLIGLARTKLRQSPRRVADEQDVVQEAFEAFFRAAEQGRLPSLRDRNDLWPLLVKITERKVWDQRKRDLRRKRGSGKVRGDSAMAPASEKDAGVAGPADDPEMAAQAADELRRLLEQLELPLARIALWRLEGLTLEEIAQQLGCVPETVMRKISRIRNIWQRNLDESAAAR